MYNFLYKDKVDKDNLGENEKHIGFGKGWVYFVFFFPSVHVYTIIEPHRIWHVCLKIIHNCWNVKLAKVPIFISR